MTGHLVVAAQDNDEAASYGAFTQPTCNRSRLITIRESCAVELFSKSPNVSQIIVAFPQAAQKAAHVRNLSGISRGIPENPNKNAVTTSGNGAIS